MEARHVSLYAFLLLAGIAKLSSFLLQVLYEDNHLLAVAKPAGLATIGVTEEHPSLARLAKSYLKTKYRKPGNVYLGVMSRLDAAATGVIVFARTSKAAARLTEQFRTHSVDKRYLAMVEGSVDPAAATLEDWVAKNESRQRMEIVGAGMPGAQLAQLVCRRIAKTNAASLVEVELQTGRKHQIRLQFSARNHPILGDRKYEGTRRFPAGIALHSLRLTVDHPTQNERMTFHCPPPVSWRALGFDAALQPYNERG